MARRHRVTVVECDAVVQRTYPYRGRLTSVHGRGGTDLRPAFAAQVLGTVKPDVIVYFTDGDGPDIDHPPVAERRPAGAGHGASLSAVRGSA